MNFTVTKARILVPPLSLTGQSSGRGAPSEYQSLYLQPQKKITSIKHLHSGYCVYCPELSSWKDLLPWFWESCWPSGVSPSWGLLRELWPKAAPVSCQASHPSTQELKYSKEMKESYLFSTSVFFFHLITGITTGLFFYCFSLQMYSILSTL